MCASVRARRALLRPRCSRAASGSSLPSGSESVWAGRRASHDRRRRGRSRGSHRGRALLRRPSLRVAAPGQSTRPCRERPPPRSGAVERASSSARCDDLAAELLRGFSRERGRESPPRLARLSEGVSGRLVFSRSCTEMAGRLSVIALTATARTAGGRPRSPRTESGGGGGILGTDSEPAAILCHQWKNACWRRSGTSCMGPPPQEGGRLRNERKPAGAHRARAEAPARRSP